jgi:hypothetical protein
MYISSFLEWDMQLLSGLEEEDNTFSCCARVKNGDMQG